MWNFPLPFLDQMLDRSVGHEFHYLLDMYFDYNQIDIALEDQEKIMFTCPYGIFSFRSDDYFLDMVEGFLEVFVDDFSKLVTHFIIACIIYILCWNYMNRLTWY